MSSEILDARAVSRDLFSATIGSICCCYVGQPFDTVKVRMQTRPDEFSHVLQSSTSILRNEVCAPGFFGGDIQRLIRKCLTFFVLVGLGRCTTLGYFCFMEGCRSDGSGYDNGKLHGFWNQRSLETNLS